MLAHDINIDQRAATRHPVDYPVLAARSGRDDLSLRIVNISTTGLVANGALGLAPGERVTVRLPVIGEIEVQLIWFDAVRAGLQFERLIRLGDFTRMFMQMQPQGLPRD
jgi:hypothetical protein